MSCHTPQTTSERHPSIHHRRCNVNRASAASVFETDKSHLGAGPANTVDGGETQIHTLLNSSLGNQSLVCRRVVVQKQHFSAEFATAFFLCGLSELSHQVSIISICYDSTMGHIINE